MAAWAPLIAPPVTVPAFWSWILHDPEVQVYRWLLPSSSWDCDECPDETRYFETVFDACADSAEYLAETLEADRVAIRFLGEADTEDYVNMRLEDGVWSACISVWTPTYGGGAYQFPGRHLLLCYIDVRDPHAAIPEWHFTEQSDFDGINPPAGGEDFEWAGADADGSDDALSVPSEDTVSDKENYAL